MWTPSSRSSIFFYQPVNVVLGEVISWSYVQFPSWQFSRDSIESLWIWYPPEIWSQLWRSLSTMSTSTKKTPTTHQRPKNCEIRAVFHPCGEIFDLFKSVKVGFWSNPVFEASPNLENYGTDDDEKWNKFMVTNTLNRQWGSYLLQVELPS